jgi:hypothetical protein
MTLFAFAVFLASSTPHLSSKFLQAELLDKTSSQAGASTTVGRVERISVIFDFSTVERFKEKKMV